ncbi:YlbF/YmcA family competence regulator [Streptococcus orisasini]
MSVNIYDLANELERNIRTLPEYQTAVQAKARVDSDEEAKKIWYGFTELQVRIQNHVKTGQMPTSEMQQELQSFGQKIETNPLLKEFAETQRALGTYINDIERIILQPLQDLSKKDV